MKSKKPGETDHSSPFSGLTQDPLVESEERFRALVTATSEVVYRMSPDWKVMRELKGRGFLSNTGEPIDDWLDKYIQPQDQQRVLKVIAEAIATKSIFELEHPVLRADGTPGWTFSRAVPIFDGEGEIVEWFGAASDITARRQMEDALRLAKEESDVRKRLYETVTNNTPDLIYVFDLQYRFTYANEALLTMWGKTWDQAVGKRLRENGYEDWHAEMHEREIDQVVATRLPIRGEVSFPHAVFGKRIYDYIFVPVLNDRGEVEAVAGTTRDITEIRLVEEALKRSREELEALVEERTRALHRSNEDLQQFAHVASHDLKEPVRKMKLFANLLRSECNGQLNEKGVGFINSMERAATRMYTMIEGILSYSSFEGTALMSEQVDLNDTIREIESDLEILIQQKQAAVQYGRLPVIAGSAVLLSQLFFNLINNSLKFSRPDNPPLIRMSARELLPEEARTAGLDGHKPYIRISFEDNGIGFAQQHAEKIFQAFSRLHSKDRFEGTGLGLSLCRKIVERHGGIIQASGKENEGAIFTIVLPLKQEEGA
ncbi:PAS domain-containing protein [Chitinophaga agrisoli]|uniref:histidine kinase n=1 Tax=Chitinophaga agrisoli TaxID=2607653 RepID=A0A5B2VVM7_9BACT|nr:PAS domain-containing sensor histidine kinase [Chitinophaga agrisoli]KAA2243331.1 PAS domain-containing protein [Chitinophaga agrisoli]